MARQRNFHRGFKQSARLTEWTGPALQSYVNVATTGATIVSSVAFEEPATVIRTRGRVSVAPQTFGADLEITGAIGMGIVTQEAFAAGVAAVPEPWTDADWGGWFVWRSFGYKFELVDATGTLQVDWGFEVDSKAMRKVSSNEVLVVVAESQLGAFKIFDGTRHLIKLP